MTADLVYFVHENCAGVSAFVNEKDHAQQRGANFVTVGALVPLSYGRLGRSWLYADRLRELAQQVVKNKSDTRPLEQFWKQCTKDDADNTSQSQSPTAGLKRKRDMSDATTSLLDHSPLVSDHPALSMPALLETVGPLLFPLARAALLRKRILVLGSAPVQQTCNYVYLLSILSSTPQSLHEMLPPEAEPLFRLRPLFSVGVHDIPVLSERSEKSSWVACTTDDILGEKHELYDLLVELEPTEKGVRRRWPRLRASDGSIVRATQRDLRRYRVLRAELRRMEGVRRRHDDPEEGQEEDDDQQPLIRSASSLRTPLDQHDVHDDSSELVEPVTWSAMAYNSFMWWASAGEKDAWEREEANSDLELLADLPDMEDAITAQSPTTSSPNLQDAQRTATVLTAYFHRLTHLVLSALADIVEEADDETEQGIEEDVIEVSFDEVRQMGLDPWSESDREFVKAAMNVWFSRDAAVNGEGVRCCSVKMY